MPDKMIRIFWGKGPYGNEGYCVEVIHGEKLENLKCGITLNSDDKHRLAGMVSLQTYEYFIREFLNEDIEMFKEKAVNAKIKEEMPFKKLFWRFWFRKGV
jgi:hypothetical protein